MNNPFIIDEFSYTQTEVEKILETMIDNILNYGIIYTNEELKYYLDLLEKLKN